MVKRIHNPIPPNGGQTTSTIVSSQKLDGGPEEKNKDENREPPTPPFYKRWKIMLPLMLAIVLAVVAGTLYWLYARQYESTDDAFIAGRPTEINPRVSGYVAALYVDDNQHVKAGDLLLQIDPADYEAALAQSRASLEAAQSNVADAQSQIALAEATERSAQADVASAEASAVNAARVLERAQLANAQVKEAVSGQEVDQAKSDARTTAAALTSSRAKAAEAKAQTIAKRADLATANANVREAEAAVKSAELNLGYTKIVAPVPGRITHRTVEKGDYLQAGQALFAIVQPELWVVANFKETQLELMKKGQPVTVKVDAFPDRKLSGHVDSFQRGTGAEFSLLPPENATGNYVKVVQRVPVKIVFDEAPPADMILGPGMSVVPTVKIR
ncbi:MAG TPA: HlyD family secretion protein [Lacipirellulaceae bacterium]|jgi:membrane fusion protein (multidrug efflux system)|nr:HlyD family secretion protein [Lacipirellulaceae bacterium]